MEREREREKCIMARSAVAFARQSLRCNRGSVLSVQQFVLREQVPVAEIVRSKADLLHA